MASQSPLEVLAARISSNAQAISAYCTENDYPSRSLERDTPSTLLPKTAPQNIRALQQSLLDSALEVQFLATDVGEFLGRLAIQNQQLGCLRWLCHFNIPNFIPLEGTISYADVAAAAKVPEAQLRSIARMAMLANFLSEPVPGQLAHNGTSAQFVANPNLLAWALFVTSQSAPMAGKMVEATEKWGFTEEKNHTAYNIAMDTDLPIFQHVASSPERSKLYAGYMKNVTTSEGVNIQHLINGFDWASLGEVTVVDVGGSSGHASISLANAFPHLKFIIEDLPGTISNSKEKSASLPPDIASRITFQAHDFFTAQPLADVDVFLLRMIIHDWRDPESITILQNLVKVLKPGGRIIIMDTVLPTPGSVSRTQEAVLRVRDLTMLQAHNSKERELQDFVHLLHATSPGLTLANVVQPFGSAMAVMEVVYHPEPALAEPVLNHSEAAVLQQEAVPKQAEPKSNHNDAGVLPDAEVPKQAEPESSHNDAGVLPDAEVPKQAEPESNHNDAGVLPDAEVPKQAETEQNHSDAGILPEAEVPKQAEAATYREEVGVAG